MDAAKSPTKVTYFKHFPHYFIRPYDAQILYSETDFVDRLNPKNCEWVTRPQVAMSEFSMAISQNYETLQNNNVFDTDFMNRLDALIQPNLPSFHNLDVKNKTATATNQDIYNVLSSCFDHSDFDASLDTSYQQVASMFVLLSQLRAFRGLVKSPEEYADKLIDDSPAAMTFKTTKSLAALQTMLQEKCITSTPRQPTPATTRELLSQLVNPSQPAPAQTTRPPTTSAAAGLTNPSTSNTNTEPNNALMDIILGLQHQVQSMQAERSTTVQSPSKKKKTKRVIEDESDEEDTTPIQSPKKATKKSKQSKLPEQPKPSQQEVADNPKSSKHKVDQPSTSNKEQGNTQSPLQDAKSRKKIRQS